MPIVNALGLTESADVEHVRSVRQFAFCECKLSRHHGYIFDGASRVDVVLWIRPNLAVALELKLGATRLTKTRIEDEFLQDCRTSHSDQRIAGNMMAILDRRFGNVASANGLSVELENDVVPLSRDWFVITRQSVLDRWVGADRPVFRRTRPVLQLGHWQRLSVAGNRSMLSCVNCLRSITSTHGSIEAEQSFGYGAANNAVLEWRLTCRDPVNTAR